MVIINSTSEKKLKLEKELTFYERERNRSLKWFLINCLTATAFIGLTLWLSPKIIELSAKTLKWLPKDGVLPKNATWADTMRLDYIKWSVFVFFLANTSLWMFWVAFRFRKWTKYRHQVHVLREELDKLEK